MEGGGIERAFARLGGTPTVARVRAPLDVDLLGAIAVGLTARVLFWMMTDRTWEDALITVAHARNAIAGLGLVHHPGEGLVHGFTSALSVLIPLASDAVVPNSDLTALRLASLAAFVVALVFARRLTRHLGISRWPGLFVLLYLALDRNHVFYGMAGMETQVAVAILLGSAWYVATRAPRRAGLWIGLAVLARPDLLIWAVCALAALFAWRRRAGWQALGVAVIVVSPWILFTLAYYGSPIPHTILAKAAVEVPLPNAAQGPAGWLWWLALQIAGHLQTLVRSFEPFFENTFVIEAPIPRLATLAVSLATFALAIRGGFGLWAGRDARPLVAFVALFAGYRLVFIPSAYSDWYVPPFTAAAVILAAAALDRIRPMARRLPAAASVVLSAAFAVQLPHAFLADKVIQADIEVGVREQVASFLRAHVPPGEPVIAESAGYFELSSGVLLHDYPGLTSPTVLRVVQGLPPDRRDIAAVVDALRDAWLVLRPNDLALLRAEYPDTATTYQVIADIHGPSTAGEVRVLGLAIVTFDREFLVLRKIDG